MYGGSCVLGGAQYNQMPCSRNRHYYLAGHGSVDDGVDPGQMYSIPRFTTSVAFYTQQSRTMRFIMHERLKGGLQQKSVLLLTTKLLNFAFKFILIRLHFTSIQISVDICSRMIMLSATFRIFYAFCSSS